MTSQIKTIFFVVSGYTDLDQNVNILLKGIYGRHDNHDVDSSF